MKRIDSQGFSHLIGLVLVILILAVASFGAWRITQHQQDTTTSAPTKTAATVPQSISTKEDVAQARQALEADDADTALNDTQLDKDITSLY